MCVLRMALREHFQDGTESELRDVISAEIAQGRCSQAGSARA